MLQYRFGDYDGFEGLYIKLTNYYDPIIKS